MMNRERVEMHVELDLHMNPERQINNEAHIDSVCRGAQIDVCV